jgi:hypothetical protein
MALNLEGGLEFLKYAINDISMSPVQKEYVKRK